MANTISSHTPGGGEARRCPVCRRACRVEPSVNAGDAPCPNCGHLLWPRDRRWSLRPDRLAVAATGVVPVTGAQVRAFRRTLAWRRRGARIGGAFRRAVAAARAAVGFQTRAAEPAAGSGGVWDRWLDG